MTPRQTGQVHGRAAGAARNTTTAGADSEEKKSAHGRPGIRRGVPAGENRRVPAGHSPARVSRSGEEGNALLTSLAKADEANTGGLELAAFKGTARRDRQRLPAVCVRLLPNGAHFVAFLRR